MEIRDVIHGSIGIDPSELPVIDSRFFQRLRQIKQLGFAENSYPSATHNRYIHSLGAMETATRAFDTIFGSPGSRILQSTPDRVALFDRQPAAFKRFRAITRAAALLHDVGHGPLSHTTEFAMPDVRELRVPGIEESRGEKSRQATHEDYTLKIILDSPLTPILEKLGKPHGFSPLHIASLVEPSLVADREFFSERLDGVNVDFQPVLQQLISSELDADRMDYLRRDSWNAGVSYGQFDFDWLVGSLTSHIENERCYLALQHKALYAFEDFLISRFHMFLMVYFHYKSVVFDEMLGKYFESPDCDYSLPADIEKYCDANDAQLYAHLAESSNEWARRISERRPFRMLVELHSGIPAGKMAAEEQQELLVRVQRDLENQKVPFLLATTTGELSKYFRMTEGGNGALSKPGMPIFVRYDNQYSAPAFIPLEKCTDLFQRYSEKRSITRLYVSPEDYSVLRKEGRRAPLKYEES